MKTNETNLPIPKNETERLLALQEYNLLDTLPEEQFDRLTKLASIICEVPIALISLVDKERQWFKSNIGLEEAKETPRDISFCQYTIMGSDFFEVEDTMQDRRFKKNPLVLGDPRIRFYAAYPLIDPKGFALGSLCIIDQNPKKLTRNQKLALKTLSDDIMLQIVSNKKNEERRKLEKFFQMSMDMICIAGMDGFFKKINPAFTNTLGWSEEELLQKPFIDFVHPDDVEKTKEELIKLTEGHTTIDFINRYRTNSNTYRLLQWVANPDPVTGELFAIARDNTYLKKIKNEIEESATTIEQLNSALNESAIVSVTDSNGIIEFVNEAFCKISKFNREELIGKHNRIIDSGFYTDTFTERIREKIEKGQVWKGEIKNKSKDGSFFWVETTIVPFLGIDKKPTRYVTVCHDVTERVTLENALRRSKDQIEKSAQIKEQFLANMSHEIRTPLNAIIGFSEILQATKLTPVQEEHAKIISQSGECLMGIINDILDYTKTESGNIVLENIPMNLKEMLNNVQKMFQKTANEKNIGLKVFLGNNIPLCVNGDPIRTNQVLVNLVGNAIKFTNKGSVNIFCDAQPKSDDSFLIEFKIQDTGIGIPADKLELIFDRFVQAENDTSRKFGGTGLGLSIVKNLVTLMGGEISVESKLGKESQFTVIIPAGKCTEKQIEEYKNNQVKTSQPNQPKNITLNILLVEDNRMNQQYVQTVLEQLGFDCTLATNGLEAINKVKENIFDVILMDIQMPQMDGYEATRIIRNELKNNTPIIALTANATSFEYDKCMQNGMNGFLSKPYKPKDLLEKINEVKKNAPLNKNEIDEFNNNLSLKEQELLINFDSIKEQVNGKITAVKQLIRIFMEDTPRDIEALEDAILHEDYNATEAISHQLVSSYSIFGISSAIKILKEMEIKAGNQKEIDVIKFLYNQLVEINEKAKTQINNSSFI